MICKCGYKNSESANFCKKCGTKLKSKCNCWVLKKEYNCGSEKCPGYNLLSKHY